jgi:DNA-binding GntR family transcriptional regulator
MPTRMDRVLSDPRTPYERIAADLHTGIVDGSYPAGGLLPTGKELARTYGVATGTAQRAVTLLSSWGLIEVGRGQRAVVRTATNPVAIELDSPDEATATAQVGSTAENPPEVETLLDLEVRRRGKVVSKFSAEANLRSPREIRQLLVDAVRRDGRDESHIAEYEMDIRHSGDRSLVTTFVARTR